MEHDTLQRTLVVGGLAAVVAAGLAVVMLVRWLCGRRDSRPVTLATWLIFLGAVSVAGLSTAWLVYERAQKCDRTVARTLCEPPSEWLRLP